MNIVKTLFASGSEFYCFSNTSDTKIFVNRSGTDLYVRYLALSGTWANRPTTVADIYEGFKYMLNDGTSHFPIYAHINGSSIEWYKADGTQYTGS